jgi:hypothetical protein
MDKFNLLTFVSMEGINSAGSRMALFKCDCGVTKSMVFSRVKSLKIESCGCLRWKNEKVLKNLNRTGIPMKGRVAKSSNHHKAKFWQLKTPNGEIIQGNNLNQLIRDNSFLFLPKDVIWNGSRCNASNGIRHLFDITKNGRVRNNSWKGWRIGDKMEICNRDLLSKP